MKAVSAKGISGLRLTAIKAAKKGSAHRVLKDAVAAVHTEGAPIAYRSRSGMECAEYWDARASSMFTFLV